MELEQDAVEPWQAAITYGDYFVSLCPPLIIFGRVHSREETVRLGVEGPAREARADWLYSQGYRFATSCSEAEPDGWMGDIHVRQVLGRITRDEFEQARAAGWRPASIRFECGRERHSCFVNYQRLAGQLGF